MHKHVPDTASSSVYKEMERQAHRFAGAFLLPAESFAAEIRSVPTLDTLLALKSRWKVSVAAMIMRLHALGLIDEGEKLNLLKRKSARFGSKAEPKDDLFAPEQPRLLKRAITLLVDSVTVPRTEMRGVFGFSNGDIEMLAGLPRDYLSPTEAAVIDLNAVRLRRA